MLKLDCDNHKDFHRVLYRKTIFKELLKGALIFAMGKKGRIFGCKQINFKEYLEQGRITGSAEIHMESSGRLKTVVIQSLNEKVQLTLPVVEAGRSSHGLFWFIEVFTKNLYEDVPTAFNIDFYEGE